MLHTSVVMVTLFKCVRFFPELRIYKLCQQKGFLTVKNQDSLNEILPAFSISHTSVMGNKISEHEFFFLSRKLLLPAPPRLSVDLMLAKPKTGQRSVLVLLFSLKSLLAL